MKSILILRREAQIKTHLANLIKNEIINEAVIEPTIVECTLSNDLSHLKVFVNFLSREKKGLEALNNASKFLKGRLAKILNWRKVPEIRFAIYEVEKESLKIDSIIDNLKKEREANLEEIKPIEILYDFMNETIWKLTNDLQIKILDVFDKTPIWINNDDISKIWLVLKSNNHSFAGFKFSKVPVEQTNSKNFYNDLIYQNLAKRKFISIKPNYVYTLEPSSKSIQIFEIASTKVNTLLDKNNIDKVPKTINTYLLKEKKENHLSFSLDGNYKALFYQSMISNTYVADRESFVFDFQKKKCFKLKTNQEYSAQKMIILSKKN